MKHKVDLDFDIYLQLDKNGVDYFCFLGDHADSVFEYGINWDSLIDRAFGYHTIPLEGDTIVLCNNEIAGINSAKELLEIADGLHQASMRIRKRLEACRVFDRDGWANAGGGDKEKFIRPFSYDDFSLSDYL